MASTAVAERPESQVAANPIVQLRTQLEARADEFRMVLPGHISPEKFQRTVITAVQQNPKLLRADRRSFITACMKAAQDALLPDGREAALVPFKTRMQVEGVWQDALLVQYMPMVYGLRKKILQSGEVKDIFASVVYRQEVENGLFIYEEGTERMLRHKPLLDPSFEPQDEDICAAYSVATYTDGTMTFEVMRRSDINKVRECSQTGALFDKKGKPREPSGPWVDWFPEQAKKSVIRRHSKTLPMSGDVFDVEAMDDALAAQSTGTFLGADRPDPPEIVTPPPRRIAPVDDDPIEEVVEEAETEPATEPQQDKPRARQQKPGKPADTVTPDNPTAAEGRDDSDRGEAHSGAEERRPRRAAKQADEPETVLGEPEQRDDHLDTANRLIAEAQSKELLADLVRWEQESEPVYEALPDDLKADVDAAIAQHRRKLQGDK